MISYHFYVRNIYRYIYVEQGAHIHELSALIISAKAKTLNRGFKPIQEL